MLKIEQDPERNTVTIEGVTFTQEFFHDWARCPEGAPVLLKIWRENGIVQCDFHSVLDKTEMGTRPPLGPVPEWVRRAPTPADQWIAEMSEKMVAADKQMTPMKLPPQTNRNRGPKPWYVDPEGHEDGE